MPDKDLLKAIEKMENESAEIEKKKKSHGREEPPPLMSVSQERDFRVLQKTRKQNAEDADILTRGILFWGSLSGILIMVFLSYGRETRMTIMEYLIYFVLCIGIYKAKKSSK